MSPTVYFTDKSNKLCKLFDMTNKNFSHMRILTVDNAKRFHLYLYDTKLNVLSIISTELAEVYADERVAYKLDYLMKNCLMTKLTNFDYNPGRRYMIDNEFLMYVQQGDVVELNVLNNQKKVYNFGKKILDQQYLMLPGKKIYYRSSDNSVNFTDLMFFKDGMSFNKREEMTRIMVCESIMQK